MAQNGDGGERQIRERIDYISKTSERAITQDLLSTVVENVSFHRR